MPVLLEGNGKFDFLIQKGRLEYGSIADMVGPVPVTGINLNCLAVVVLDGCNPYDFGHGVAAGVMVKGPKTIPAGWFHAKFGRRYRHECAAFGIDPGDPVLCMAKLYGGEEHQFRKGPMRLPFRLALDLAWPISLNSDWYAACRPYLRQIGAV